MKLRLALGALALAAAITMTTPRAIGQQGGGGAIPGIPAPTGTGQCFVSTSAGIGHWVWGSCSGSSNLAFSSLTTGTNTGATMTLGSGSTLNGSGTANVDFSGIAPARLKLPLLAGATTSANGNLAYDLTNLNWHIYANGADSFVFVGPVSGTYTNNDCVKFGVTASNITLVDAGAACGSGGGGGGTVTQVNTGAGLTGGPITGSGTISVPNSGITNVMLANSTIGIAGTTNQITSSTATPSLGGSTTLAIANPFTFPGKATTVASASGGAGFNLPQGAAPSAPANGDLWTTSSGLFVRIAGSTIGPLNIGTGNTTSTGLTTNTLPIANGANSIINSNESESGGLFNIGTTNGLATTAATPSLFSGKIQPGTSVTVPATFDFSTFLGSDNVFRCQLSAGTLCITPGSMGLSLSGTNTVLQTSNMTSTTGNGDFVTVDGSGNTQDSGTAPATGVMTFLGTPSSANLFSALTTKTGSGGSVVFATGPTISAAILTGSLVDASGATQFKLPVATGYTPAANGELGYDSTNLNWHAWGNGIDNIVVLVPASTSITNSDCVKWVKSSNVITLGDTGSACGAGGASALSGLTNATTSNTLTNGNNPQTWNWAQTTAAQYAMTFGESSAKTGAGGGTLLISTAAGSTGIPLTLTDSLTGSQTLPALSITPTWNTSGVVDAALLINVTNSGSGTGSLIADFQIGGSSKFSFDKAGNMIAAGNLTGTGVIAGSALASVGSATGIWACAEASTGGTPTSGQDYIRCDSTAHQYKISLNGGAEFISPMNLPLAGSGAGVTTGPTSGVTSLDVAEFTGTGGQVADSSVAVANLVTAASNYTNGDLVQAAGNNKTTSDAGIAVTAVVTATSNLTNTALMTGAGLKASQTPCATCTLDSSGNLAVAAGGSLGSADTGTPKFTFASNAATFNKALTTLSLTSQNGTSLGGTAYSYGAPSTTGGAALLIPATTYTVTGAATTANFQAYYQGAATFTDASAGTVTDAFDAVKAGPAVAAGSLTITRAHTLGILDSTSASSSITGGLVVAATFGTTATSVGIGGGNVNAGGNGTFGGTLSVTGHVTVEGVTSTGATGTGKFVFDTTPTLSNPVVGTQTQGNNSTTAASTAYVDGQNIIVTTGLTAGHAYYVSAANTLSEAGGGISATAPAACVAISTTQCIVRGTYTTTGLTAGAVYYVPTASGLVTSTEPSSTGQFVQRVGIALSTTVLMVNISYDVGTIQ